MIKKVKFISKEDNFGVFTLNSLTYNKEYEVISIERGWYRVDDDSGDDYLYPPELFEIIEQ